MDIITKQWICVNCDTVYVDKNDKPLQIDYIDDKIVLLSNYYDQYLINKQNDIIKINDCYCLSCINKFVILKNTFEPEPEYTFEQNGYICWDIEKRNTYKRECGVCSGCQTAIEIPSLLLNRTKNFMILWSPQLCSLAFHDFDIAKVYTLDGSSKYYQDNNKPLMLCEDCFKQEDWIKHSGSIICQFCQNTYCRAVNRYDDKPIHFALECCVHTNQDDGYIYDGLIDPELYQWVNQPINYDKTKFFCLSCLQQFIDNNII
jgi:hypothetical protein